MRFLQSSGLAAQEGPTEQEMDMGYTSYNYKEKYTYIKKNLENKINCYQYFLKIFFFMWTILKTLLNLL